MLRLNSLREVSQAGKGRRSRSRVWHLICYPTALRRQIDAVVRVAVDIVASEAADKECAEFRGLRVFLHDQRS